MEWAIKSGSGLDGYSIGLCSVPARQATAATRQCSLGTEREMSEVGLHRLADPHQPARMMKISEIAL